jgi:acyl dehydratase
MAYPLAMRTPLLFALALALSLVAAEANARAFDAKQLARYDASYGKCESQFPDMRGHGDEAYLNLWRIKLDDKTKTRLDRLRGGAVYQAEKQRLLRASASKVSAAASSPLIRECQGLWAEYQRTGKPKR